jgi:hypothetical protein
MPHTGFQDQSGGTNPMAGASGVPTFLRMNTFTRTVFLFVCLLSSATAFGQYQFEFTFRGTAWTTNAAGDFVSRPVDDGTLLQDYAQANGVTDTKNLRLVYHYNGDERGDVIEVYDLKNGAVVYPLISLFFGEALGRTLLPSGDGKRFMRIEYTYGHQIDHSTGSAFIYEKYATDSAGNTNHTFQGSISFFMLPDAAHGMQMYNGTFFTGKTVNR